MTYALGIDIGGTNVKAVRVSPAGETLEKYSFPTEDGAQPGFIAAVPAFVKEQEQQHGPAMAIGVSSPGLASRDQRTITWMMGRMQAVMGLDWTDHLRRDALVPVLNDAQAALLGEVWLGAARGARDAVLLTLGTGVGGAILCDGHLLRGHIGRAGHLGHLTVHLDVERDIVNSPGSIELFIGDATIEARTGGRFSSTRDLVDAAVKGDTQAQQVWDRSIKALAAALTSIVNAVDPATVILGGGMIAAGDALLAPLAKYMDQFEWRPTGRGVEVVLATLGDHAGAYGCAYEALRLAGAIKS
jgi:glucokinase